MSHFNSGSRREARSGGDGVVTLNDKFASKNPLQMSVNPSPVPKAKVGDDKYVIEPHNPSRIQADEVSEAITFRDSKKSEHEDTFSWLSIAVDIGIALIAILAAVNGMMKVGSMNLAEDAYLNRIAGIGVIGGLIIGPIILFILKKGMKIGSFHGWSLVAAWVTMGVIVADEVGGLYSLFEPSFTETYFQLAAFAIPVILTLTFTVDLLKPDVRRKRQLIKLHESERHEIAVGAIKERKKKIKAESRARQLANIASTAARWKMAFMTLVTMMFRGWGNLFGASVHSVMSEADNVASSVGYGKKKASRKATAKKASRRWLKFSKN